jgi:hypothetical protein
MFKLLLDRRPQHHLAESAFASQEKQHVGFPNPIFTALLAAVVDQACGKDTYLATTPTGFQTLTVSVEITASVFVTSLKSFIVRFCDGVQSEQFYSGLQPFII